MEKQKSPELERLVDKWKIALEGTTAAFHSLIPIEGQRFYYKKTKQKFLASVGVTAYQLGTYTTIAAYIAARLL
ncbi:MAG: hypothetical protein ISS23_01935 [Nanoarchaeota archaeon]|nr:hypothetical protein [Nanoarchaeota archaeon]